MPARALLLLLLALSGASAAAPGAVDPPPVAQAFDATSVSLSWAAPDDGGAQITAYTLRASPGSAVQTVTGSPATPAHVFTGLAAGVAYAFNVSATNADGTGPASGASNAAAPAPIAFFSATPGAFSNDLTPEFGLSADAAGVVFRLCVDGDCASIASSDLDAVPITAWIEQGPSSSALQVGETVVFELGSQGGETAEYSLDASAWYGTSSLEVTLTPDEGWHALLLRAVNGSSSDPVGAALHARADADDTRQPDTLLESFSESSGHLVMACDFWMECDYLVNVDGAETHFFRNNEVTADGLGLEDGFHFYSVTATITLSVTLGVIVYDPTPLVVSFVLDRSQAVPAPETYLDEDRAEASCDGLCYFEYSLDDLGATWTTLRPNMSQCVDVTVTIETQAEDFVAWTLTRGGIDYRVGNTTSSEVCVAPGTYGFRAEFSNASFDGLDGSWSITATDSGAVVAPTTVQGEASTAVYVGTPSAPVVTATCQSVNITATHANSWFVSWELADTFPEPIQGNSLDGDFVTIIYSEDDDGGEGTDTGFFRTTSVCLTPGLWTLEALAQLMPGAFDDDDYEFDYDYYSDTYYGDDAQFWLQAWIAVTDATTGAAILPEARVYGGEMTFNFTVSPSEEDAAGEEAEGPHVLAVRSVVNGITVDESPATVAWYQEAEAAPVTSLRATPPNITTSTTAAFEADGCDPCEYSLDRGATWTATGSSSFALTELQRGQSYDIAVRTVDAVSAVPARWQWLVAEEPVVAIRAAPESQSIVRSPTVVVATEVTGGSQCSLTSEFDGLDVSDLGGVFSGLEDDLYTLRLTPTCEQGAGATEVFEFTVRAPQSSAELTITVAGEDEYEARIWATDALGNVAAEPTIETWVVDRTPPNTTLTWFAAADEVILVSVVEFGVGCEDVSACTLEVSLDGVLVESVIDTDNNTVVLRNVADGAHNVSVVAQDAAGNRDAAPLSVQFSVDANGPTLNISTPGGRIGAAPVVQVECWDLSGCDAVVWNVDDPNALPEGVHDLVVVATDVWGHNASASVTVVVDQTAPSTTGTVAEAGYRFTDVEVDVGCTDALSACAVTLNGSVVQSPALLTGLREGVTEVLFQSVDEAGNVDSEGWTAVLTVDSEPPQVAILGLEYTGGGHANVTVACLDNSACSVHLVPGASNLTVVSGADSGGVQVLRGAREGNVSAVFTAVDAVGNEAESPAVRFMEVDFTAPVVEFSTPAPDAHLPSLRVPVNFTLDSPVAGCACTVNDSVAVVCGEDVVADASARIDYAVECWDAAGNVGTGAIAFWIDVDVPELDVAWPSALSTTAELVTTFALSSDATATCLDQPCTSPWVYTVPSDGQVALRIEAADQAGNVVNASRSVVVDTVAPSVEFTETPGTLTTATHWNYSFWCFVDEATSSEGNACGGGGGSDSSAATELEEDPDCRFECAFDGAAAEPCDDFSTAIQDEAAYTLEVTAFDSAGNSALVSVTTAFVADIEPPTFQATPPRTSAVDHAYFEFSAELPGLQYRLDGGAWQWEAIELLDELTGALQLTGLALGDHDLEVRVEDGEAAVWSWSYSKCAAVDELQYEAPDGELKCVGCRGETEGCALDGAVAEGFWVPAASDGDPYPQPYTCNVERACPGHAACASGAATCDDDAQQCRRGYGGPLCAVCTGEYELTLTRECARCDAWSSLAVTVVLGLVALSVLLGASLLVVRQSLNTSDKALVVSIVKIIANYLMLMGVLKSFSLDWQTLLTTFFSYMGVASGGGATDVQLLSCAFSFTVYDKYLVFMLTPVVIVVAPAVLIGAAVLRQRTQNEKKENKKVLIWGETPRFLYRQSVLVLSYFSYTSVVSVALRVLHCDDVDGVSYLVDDYSERCDGPTYGAYQAVAIALLCTVVPGVPLGILWSMRGSHNERQFFFLSGDYTSAYGWWEATVMLRKGAMTAIGVLLGDDRTGWQVYAGTWLLLASFSAQMACRPQRSTIPLLLETAAQGTVLFSLLLGSAIPLSESSSDGFRVAILVLNAVVVEGMFLVLGRELLREARARLRPTNREPAPFSSASPPAPAAPAAPTVEMVNPLFAAAAAEAAEDDL